MSQINQEIVTVKFKIAEFEKAQQSLHTTEESLLKQKQRLKIILEQLLKEEKDLQKLETGSFSSFFFDLIGKKEQKLQKEKQEFLSAKALYDNCKDSIEFISNEKEKRHAKLLSLGKPKADYKNLITQKENALKCNSEYLAVIDLITQEKAHINELKEAIEAGEKAHRKVQDVHSLLNSAGNWGLFDTLGGGLISTAMKHSKIDDANRAAQFAENYISAFVRELADVEQFSDAKLKLDIGGFAQFADFFFDGLISDLFVQSKINNSQATVKNTEIKLSRVLSQLKKSLSESHTKLEQSKEQKAELLEYL